MLNPADIIELARVSTGAPLNGSLLDDVQLTKYLNFVYHEVENKITKHIDADYFKKNFTTDILSGISKYRIKDNIHSFKDIYNVSIRRESDGEYQRLYEIEKETVSTSSNNSMSYDINGEYIELYSEPEKDIPDGLRITATINLPDLTPNSTKEEVFLGYSELSQSDNVLLEGLRYWIYRIMEKTNEAENAYKHYQQDTQQLLSDIATRSDEFFEIDFLSHIPRI